MAFQFQNSLLFVKVTWMHVPNNCTVPSLKYPELSEANGCLSCVVKQSCYLERVICVAVLNMET
jgi:hypothetical protein